MDVEVGKEIDLHIDRLGIHGEGVGSLQGYTIFADGALPGETARVRISERRKNFGRATLVKLKVTSTSRTVPICPLFGKCGGCQVMHIEYPGQLHAKRQRVIDALERIGKFFEIEVHPCRPSPLPLFYRNKIQLPVKPMDEKTGRGIRLGLYAHNTHDLIEIDRCYIHCELGEKAFQHIQHWLKNTGVLAYHPQLEQEGLRHVLIKTAVHNRQVLVVLVMSHADASIGEAYACKLMEVMPEIRGVVENVNPVSGNTVLSNDFRVLAGQGYIEERIHGLLCKVSPASFFQVNPIQAEKLYQKALECASLTGKEVVLDAYCGVGTLSLLLAKHAQKVIGVECVKEAIIDAEENARLNGIHNATFTCAQAEDFIPSLSNIDVAILNPPRKGCENSFLHVLAELKPRRIVYISCDPATLARDLSILRSKGYILEKVEPFDMFPQTAHVECVASLSLDLCIPKVLQEVY